MWLGVLNLPLALYLSSAYAPSVESNPWFVTATYGAASFGHYFLLFALISLFLIFPVFVFKEHIGKWRFIYATTIITLCHVILATDAKVFELYRFHINYAMLDLFFNAGGEVIELSTDTWISIVFQVAFCAFYSAIVLTIAMFLAYRGIKARIIATLAILCYIIANLIHAYSAAKQVFPILDIQNRIPLYHPLTMNKKLIKWGIVEQSSGANSRVEIGHSGLFDYPKEPLYYFDNAREPYNVLLLVVDALRYDMLNEDTMPNTWSYAQDAWVYNNHYSSSNSTRGGIFGMFYGIPGSYWMSAYSTGKPSAISTAVLDRSYAYGIFSSANLYMPEFNTTVFSNVPNLRINSQGNDAVERDLDAIKDFKSFISNLQPEQKFFSFVFLDNVHSYAYPSDFQEKFLPSSAVNHLELNKNTDRTPYFNRYRNAVHYADQNIKSILDTLSEYGYDQNTIVIITADHGEEFNDTGENYWGHNSNFTDYQSKIPFIMKWPGKGANVVDTLSSSFDISATILPRVLAVRNPVKDYSIGSDLFELPERKYVIASSYLDNALIEKDRIVLLDKFGLLHFKDKNFKDSSNTTRDAHLFDAIKIMSYYLQSDDKSNDKTQESVMQPISDPALPAPTNLDQEPSPDPVANQAQPEA